MRRPAIASAGRGATAFRPRPRARGRQARHRGPRPPGLASALLLGLLLAACARFEPRPLGEPRPDPATIETQRREGLAVSAAILPDAEAEAIYGADISSVGLQAIWLSADNATGQDLWLLVPALDPDYYAPDEAAMLLWLRYGPRQIEAVTERFRALAMPMKVPEGERAEGFVLAPRREGGRYLLVSFLGGERYLEFGFPIVLPDGDFDFEKLQPDRIYGQRPRAELDRRALRETLAALPCCTANADGTRLADPLNLVVVGDTKELLTAMSRGGWSFTHRIGADTVRRLIGAAITGAEYPVAPVSPLHLFGRKQDLALQRARETIVQRNHLRLWLAPFLHRGRSVWLGQVSRDIGLELTTKSPTLTSHRIDPNVDEAREHLLQSLLTAGALRAFGFVAGVPPATPEAPAENLTGDPYFTDGRRLVLFLAGAATIPPQEVEFLDWARSADPTREARGEAPGPGGEP